MTTTALIPSPNETRRLIVTLLLGTTFLVVFGVLVAGSAESLIAYLSITTFAVLPAGLWIWTGAKGVPILPAVSVFHYIYYAIPVLRNEVILTYYAPFEIARAGLTTALFLIAATVSWAPLIWQRPRRSSIKSHEIGEGRGYRLLVFLGLGFGIVYYIALFSGLLTALGPLVGLARSVMLTATLMACFMLGHSRARGLFQGTNWALAVGGLGVIVASALATLFLVAAVIYCIAAVFGFVITRKKIPWKFVGATAAVIVVLHAGKADMREKYWMTNTNSSAEISITQIPGFLVEWSETGLAKLTSGQVYSSAIDRVSLMQLVLHVQRLSPDLIPYLDGESYSQLLNILVPRFINPDKQASQYAMSLLSVRYGLQTQKQTETTAIGWGVLAESFANFGYLGVIGGGLLLGLMSGLFERASAGAEVISLRTLFAIVLLLQVINMEADATALISSLAQSLAAVWIFFGLYRLVSKKQARSLPHDHRSVIAARRRAAAASG
jgi:hypothetical protein